MRWQIWSAILALVFAVGEAATAQSELDPSQGLEARSGLAILYGRVLHPPFHLYLAGDTLLLAAAGRAYPLQPPRRMTAPPARIDPQRLAEHRALRRARERAEAAIAAKPAPLAQESLARERSLILQAEVLAESQVQGLLTEDAYRDCVREARRAWRAARGGAKSDSDDDRGSLESLLAQTLRERAQRELIPERAFFIVFASGAALGVDDLDGRQIVATDEARLPRPRERLAQLQRHLNREGALILGQSGQCLYLSGVRAQALRRALTAPDGIGSAFPAWLARDLAAPASRHLFQEVRP